MMKLSWACLLSGLWLRCAVLAGLLLGVTSASAVVASFNVVQPAADPVTGKIFTKVAGLNFVVDIVALDGASALDTGFAGTVGVEVVDATTGGGVCSAMTAVATFSNQVFAAGDLGRHALTSPNASAVARATAKLRVTYPVGAPTITSCSTDSFTIRPQSFSVASSNANADATGTSSVATPVVKAGSAFALTATAIAGYGGTPAIDIGKATFHAGAVNTTVVLSGSFTAANVVSGAAAGAAFAYSEVGYFRLGAEGVYDDQFTATDYLAGKCTNDFSNTLVGGKYGCKFGNTAATDYFGRFVPDRLAITAGSLIDRADLNTGPTEAICASTFTYMGEDFKTTFTLTAQNSSAGTTENYTGAHAKFVLGTWGNHAFTASGGTLVPGSAAPSGAWSSSVGSYGTAAVTATHLVTRPASPATPLTSFAVSALPSYVDGMAIIALAPATAVVVHAGTSEQRYGRLRLLGAYGSELFNVRLPVRAEYYGGTNAWTLNTADNCTSLPGTSIALGNYVAPPAGTAVSTANMGVAPTDHRPAGAITMTGGSGTIVLTKPSPAATGSFDVVLNLGNGVTNSGSKSCEPASFDAGYVGGTAPANSLSFLLGNWCGAAYDKAPSARVKLGTSKAPYIYLRERY